MKNKNSKIKKAVTKKIPLEKTAYYTLRRMLFPLQKEIENIRIGVWDLECMLREREWEASEKKNLDVMVLKYLHLGYEASHNGYKGRE